MEWNGMAVRGALPSKRGGNEPESGWISTSSRRPAIQSKCWRGGAGEGRRMRGENGCVIGTSSWLRLLGPDGRDRGRKKRGGRRKKRGERIRPPHPHPHRWAENIHPSLPPSRAGGLQPRAGPAQKRLATDLSLIQPKNDRPQE